PPTSEGRVLTTDLTTYGTDFGGQRRTTSEGVPHLSSTYVRPRTSMDTLHRIGNRVSCKGPWVQIPPSPLLALAVRPRGPPIAATGHHPGQIGPVESAPGPTERLDRAPRPSASTKRLPDRPTRLGDDE